LSRLTCSKPGNPKNVVLLIGDGMGLTQICAGKGASVGQRNKTYLELCDWTAFCTIFAADRPITDSAASATALASGEKTDVGVVGCTPEGRPLPTLVDYGKELGKWAGIVTNTDITHATPACFYAHVTKRGRENQIAAQLVESDIELFIGGGRRFFLPKSMKGSKRPDETNLLAKAKEKGYHVAADLDDVRNVSLANDRILALLELGPMPKTSESSVSVSAMTKFALEKLRASPNGFFLMIEGGQIDWAGHKNDAQWLVDEMADFDLAIGHALAFAAEDAQTLVIVTADHETGGMGIPRQDEDARTVWVDFTTSGHTGVMVPVVAAGLGAPVFHGFIDNTDVPKLVRSVWK